jgi:hypothetical protein
VGAHRLGQARSGRQTLGERAPAHVQVAVSQPGFLADIAVALDRKGQHLGGGEHLDLVDHHFDLARGQTRIRRFGRTSGHHARDGDNALEPQVRQRLECGPVGVGHQLHQFGRLDASRVTQVNEEQSAVVPLGRHPSGQPHRAPHVSQPERS